MNSRLESNDYLLGENLELRQRIGKLEKSLSEEKARRREDKLAPNQKERDSLAGIGGDATRLVAAEEALQRSEEALNKSEKRYLKLVKYAPVGIYEMDFRNERFLSVNDEMSAITGYSREELLDMNPFALLDNESRMVLKERIGLWLKGVAPEDKVDYQIVTKQGQAIYASLNVFFTTDANGNPHGATGIVHDITERKKAEQIINRQNSILKGINRIFQEALNCETEEELGKTCLKVAEELTQSKFGFIESVSEEGCSDVLAISDPGWEASRKPKCSSLLPKGLKIHGIRGRVVQDGRTIISNKPAVHPDYIGLPEGHPPISAFLGTPLIQGDQVIGIIGLGNKQEGYSREDADTLETLSHAVVRALMCKRSEEKLRQNEKLYHTLFDNSRDGFILGDIIYDESRNPLDVVVQKVNTVYETQLGIKATDVLGKRYSETLRTLKLEDLKIVDNVVKSGESVHFEKHNKISNRWYDVHLFPYSENGFGELFREITDKKKVEAEIARLDRLNLIGEMAASIGHEIRNPMTSVRGFLQLLGGNNEYQKDKAYFDLMIEELDRANEIITEFLSLAKNKRVELKLYSLDTIVTALHPIMMSDANIREINICLDLNSPPEVLIDASEIRQLILNIARNGLEAINEKGTLTIGTSYENHEIILYIKDNGPGLAPEVLDKLGTPFLTTKDSGTGLGLAICYSIAARNSATIHCQTGPDGTTFFIRFPLPALSD